MKKKSLVLTLTAVMLALAVGIGGTIAYFTAQTKAVTNTFTAGNVDKKDVNIELDEAKVTKADNAWTAEEANRVPSNTYEGVYPAAQLPKDPTIRATGSQNVWVAIKLELDKHAEWKVALEKYDLGDFQTAVIDTIGSDWVVEAKGNGVYMCYAQTQLVPGAENEKELFQKLNIPSQFVDEDVQAIGNFELKATGYAVQTVGGVSLETAHDELSNLAGFPVVK